MTRGQRHIVDTIQATARKAVANGLPIVWDVDVFRRCFPPTKLEILGVSQREAEEIAEATWYATIAEIPRYDFGRNN